MAFILQNKETKKYRTGRGWRTSTSDEINDARVFGRKCDASRLGSVNSPNSKWQIVEVALVPVNDLTKTCLVNFDVDKFVDDFTAQMGKIIESVFKIKVT